MRGKLQVTCTVALTCACTGWAMAQDAPPAPAPVLKTRTVATRAAAGVSAPESAAALPVREVPLIVPRGAPLQIRLDQEVRVKKAGQTVHGKVTEAVYAFDRMVIPEGTEVMGRIMKLEDISGGRRTLSALDADFTPYHKLVLEFDELVMADGTHRALQTSVMPGAGQIMEFVTAKQGDKKGAVSAEFEKAKQQAKQAWNDAKKQVTEPGRMHRLERYLVAQLPFHPQYLDAGAMFSAELEEPLDFGTTPLTGQMVASMCQRPALGSLVHARLITPLSSATAKDGEPIEAVLTRPLFDGENLILPTGSSLKGTVLEAHPSGKLRHNGDLRVVFHQLQPPDCQAQWVNAVPVGVAAARAEHLELDSEGGAKATSAPTRYLDTALALGLAAASSGTDGDAQDGGGNVAGNASNRAAGGVGGFKLVGLAVSLAVKSQPLGMAMGALGASRSIYKNFLSQGHEVVFPKNTAMAMSVGGHPAPERGCSVPASDATPEQMEKAAACTLRNLRIN